MILCFIISVIIGIALFLCMFIGFREGIRLGATLNKGQIPEKTRSPIKVMMDLKQDIKISKEAKEEADELAKMFAFNGDKPKEGE